MKGKGERELEGRGRTSSYLELLSCNLLERRQERYKQKSQTDSFWLWGEWNISYLVAKWQSVLIVHNTATTLRGGTPGLKSKKIPVVFLLPSLAIYFSLIFLHTHTHPCTVCWLVSHFTNDQTKTLAGSAPLYIFKLNRKYVWYDSVYCSCQNEAVQTVKKWQLYQPQQQIDTVHSNAFSIHYAHIYIYCMHTLSVLWIKQTSQDYFKQTLDTSNCAMISNKSQCYPNSYVAAGSSSRGWRLELGCQCRLEGVARGLKQQLSDWQLLITATRQNRTVKYYPSPLNFFFFIFTSSTLNTFATSPAVDRLHALPQTSLWNDIIGL